MIELENALLFATMGICFSVSAEKILSTASDVEVGVVDRILLPAFVVGLGVSIAGFLLVTSARSLIKHAVQYNDNR